MTATMQIRVVRDAKESLTGFAKKWRAFQAHIQRLQCKGHLPIDRVFWQVSNKGGGFTDAESDPRQMNLPL
jgi:hypothetical protein